jgi:hypothetical protein
MKKPYCLLSAFFLFFAGMGFCGKQDDYVKTVLEKIPDISFDAINKYQVESCTVLDLKINFIKINGFFHAAALHRKNRIIKIQKITPKATNFECGAKKQIISNCISLRGVIDRGDGCSEYTRRFFIIKGDSLHKILGMSDSKTCKKADTTFQYFSMIRQKNQDTLTVLTTEVKNYKGREQVYSSKKEFFWDNKQSRFRDR